MTIADELKAHHFRLVIIILLIRNVTQVSPREG